MTKCEMCDVRFVKQKATHRFCSTRCRCRALRAIPSELRRPRKVLRCRWCRGRHTSEDCPNPGVSGGTMVKQYGSIGPNREYVPPPGVKVRHVFITSFTHGDKIAKLMKEVGE